jgi:hypothetical protein
MEKARACMGQQIFSSNFKDAFRRYEKYIAGCGKHF